MSNKRIFDLSYEIYTGMPIYPGDSPKPKITMVGNIEGSDITLSSFQLGSHCGTHIDAPRHFFSEGKTLLEFSPDHFFGRAICLKKTENSAGEINLSDQDIELLGREKPDWVLIHTGFDKLWGKNVYFSDHPYLSGSAVEYLTGTEIWGLGVDFPSIDAAGAKLKDYPVHHAWLNADRLAVENLCCLENLLNKQPFDFCALPLKMNTEGAPVRALAFL